MQNYVVCGNICALFSLKCYFTFFLFLGLPPPHPAGPTLNREPFEEAYKVAQVLGKGGFGIVYAGTRKRDGLQVAIKHIAKAKIKDWGQVGQKITLVFSIFPRTV